MGSSSKTDSGLIFVDSSVLFSARYSSTGFARDLLVAGQLGHLRLATSSFVLSETQTNLSAKSAGGLAMLAAFAESGMYVLAEPIATLISEVEDDIDPKDAPILAAAIACGASVIASFDQKHLLSATTVIERRWRIRILTPGTILAERQASKSRSVP